MLNFTVGPVMSDPEINLVTSQSTPYFRTSEFSELMLENEKYILEYMKAPSGSRCVFLTASGTGSMESVVMNVINDTDKVIVINGGSFGKRFVDLCELHNRDYYEVKCDFGCQLRRQQLEDLKDCTVLLVNMHETSSGVLYDMNMISEFCKENNILLIVDAISAFIADEINMEDMGAAVIITGSQKALAVQPGISIIALSPEALNRVQDNKEVCMYLSLKDALKNGERGQTPFTPAVAILLQINKRLKMIEKAGGIEQERIRIAKVAKEFREGIKDLPFEIVPEFFSNAVTCLKPLNGGAKKIVNTLKDDYKIWVCPNGGDLSDTIFRVGHIGYISDDNNQELINALHDMNKKGLL